MALNISMVYSYFEVARMIVEEEHNGKQRAEYGKAILKELSECLTKSLGKGFSEFFALSLMRIPNIDERHFYGIEAVRNGWVTLLCTL